MAYANIEDRRAASKRNYYDNKEVYIEKSRVRRLRLYDAVIRPAKDVPCKDCKNRFPSVCMDFDHVIGEKLFDIAGAFDRYPLAVLLEEIKKCEVVCANCHRLRTSKRVSEADSSNRQDGTLRTFRSECNSLVGFQV